MVRFHSSPPLLLGIFVVLLQLAACARPLEPWLEETSCAHERSARRHTLLAGSGATINAARVLTAELTRTRPELVFEIAESIGTTGGVRALRDGAVDVGLASRPLRPEELAYGLTRVVFARGVVAVAAYNEVAAASTSRAELVRLFTDPRRQWADGTPVVPVLREPGDSATAALVALVPELGPGLEQARRSAHGISAYTDKDALAALRDVRGAVGLVELGTARASGVALSELALEGVAPSAEAVAQGRYPLWLELSLLLPAQSSEAARALSELATSARGKELLLAAGYAPP